LPSFSIPPPDYFFPPPVVKVTIQIKDSFFAQFEHIFVWTKYMKLRPPDQFASAKLIGGKAELKSGMLLWTKVGEGKRKKRKRESE
jgi:hypothetical protein